MDPRLYILMRTDLVSMNSGKGMAQAAHASNAFVHHVNNAVKTVTDDTFVHVWQKQTPQGFGTTIVLAVPDEKTMQELVESAIADGFFAGIVHDPGYPVRDGRVTHEIPLNTCAYIFLPEPDKVMGTLGRLPLHP